MGSAAAKRQTLPVTLTAMGTVVPTTTVTLTTQVSGILRDVLFTEGQMVKKGQKLGEIRDYFGEKLGEYFAPCDGVMLYVISSLSSNQSLGSGNLLITLQLGKLVTTLFAVIFLFYTNSFLMKRRKKEFGLLNILGMGKKHIALVIFCETLILLLVSLVFLLLLTLIGISSMQNATLQEKMASSVTLRGP